MSRKAAQGVKTTSAHQAVTDGRAYRLGWFAFLVFVAATPLVMGVLPPQFGSLAVFLRASDSVVLPKVVAMLVLSGLSLSALCVSVLRGESELRWHPALWILVGFFGWAGVSTLFSASPARAVLGGYNSNDGLVAILGYGVVAFLAVQYVRSTRALRVVMATAAIAGSIASAYALMQVAGLDPLVYTTPLDRVFSTFGNSDMFGDYLVFPFALALGLALSTPGRWAPVRWWAAVALLGAVLLMTGTRGAWLGASVVAVCFGVSGWRRVRLASRRQKWILAGVAIAAIGAGALLVAYMRPLAFRGLSLPEGLTRLSSGRTVIWLTGLRAWLTRPITGWGPDGFGSAFLSAAGPEWYALIEGLQKADTAHNIFVQVLVTLGLPGLAIMVWAWAQTAIRSLRVIRSASDPVRTLHLAPWAALVGMIAASTFGVTLPSVVVWIWLAVGLLLAPISYRVSPSPRAVLGAATVAGIALALWASSWLVADVISGQARQLPDGSAQVSAFRTASRWNPLSPDYRWLLAESVAKQAYAEQNAGQSRDVVDATMQRAIGDYYVAANANRGDAMVRVALANALIDYARAHPGGDAAQRAVSVSLDAVKLAPLSPATLVVLARAYEIAGRHEEAVTTARLARAISPAYSMQTLGSLGIETTTTP